MKHKIKSLLSLTAAILATGAHVQAQEISTSLPLTSIGDRLLWEVADQNLQLTVPVAGQVRLELYSPRVDPKDYRSDNYFGDEEYSPEPVSTTFTLLRQDGSVVMARTFEPGAHNWETLFDQNLPAGNYKLVAATKGNGKNTFAVRLAGVSAALSADRLAVNVHSADWIPVLNVTTDAAGYVLKMYDGDGPQELEARLRDAAGKTYPLAVSGDKAWSDLPLPDQAGQYTVELRQPKTAKQYSNTVSFSLNRGGTQTPLTISKVDQTGLLKVTAELLLPTGTVPADVNVLVGNEHVQVSGETTKTVAAGEYPIGVTDIPGAQVSADQSKVVVAKGSTSDVKVQVKPQVALSLSSDKQDVCVGDTVTLTARATTAYAGALPLDLSIDAPNLTLNADAGLKGELSAAKPGELRLTGTATQAGPLTVTARLAPWDATQSVQLNVRPDATSLQLSRAPLDDAKMGDTVTVHLSVTNTADQEVPFTLVDTPAAGLQALESTKFEGKLAAGETRELTYKAKVTADAAGAVALNAILTTPSCTAPQEVGGSLNVTARPAPDAVRRSTITLPFDAPRESKTVTIAHTVPVGATLVAGSSKLDGQAIADPKRGASGTLYWTVPAPTSNGTAQNGAALRGVLTYEVNHSGPLGTLASPALSVVLSGNRTEVLQGQINAADLTAASELGSEKVQLSENSGAIKLPLADSVIRVRDRISVTVEAPQGDIPVLTVNGKAVSPDLIGTNTQDPGAGTQRLTFVGVPIQSGPNVIHFLNQEITVNRVGATAKIEVTPLETIADGSTPIRLKLRTYDAFGQLTDQTSLTVNSNLEPRTPDANPSESGYQVRLVNGEGILELQPQSSPTTLKLGVLQDQKINNYSFDITPDSGSVGVGVLSATVGLNGNFSVQNNLTWQARAYYEGPLAGGKLYVAADKDKLPTEENTLIRYPAYGDASTEAVPLQGIDPVALTYDNPKFRLDYRQSTLPIDVLPVGEQLTALTAYSKTNPQISGFVAAVPSDLISNTPLIPQGNRILRLPDGRISAGSETLVLTTLERGTGKVLKQVTLTRNVDYVLDIDTGIITLARALDHVDNNLNEQVVYASYRLNNPMSKRNLAFGVQLKQTGDHYSVGVAAVSLDSVVTYGARATYDNGKLQADGLVAYSGGLQVSGNVITAPNDRQMFSARLRYQQSNYVGLGKFSDGLNVSGSYTGKITDRLTALVDAEYHNVPSSAVNSDPLTGIDAPDTAYGGSVTARADYKLDPFSVGLGGKYAFGDIYGLGVVGSVGYHTERINVDVVHTQPLSGNLATTTDITSKFTVAKNLNLGFTDKFTWGIGHAAALTLDTIMGNVNYAVGYELPTASGAGNRARFSVGTSLPLGERMALGVRGSALYDMQQKQYELGTGADLNYKTDAISATVGTDLTLRSGQFGVVVRGGLTGSVTDHLTLTADGLVEYAPAVNNDTFTDPGKNGQRFSLGYAYRNRTLNSLGYVRYVNGTLAGDKSELSSGISAEYRQPTWALRGGADTRTLLTDKDSFTWQAYAGGTAYLTDYFGIGAWARTINQPSSGYNALGYGLEGSFRAMPGTWFSAGYNFKGFDGIPTAGTYTKQGAYVRLDITLDESLGKKK